jgi:hypothetical protein
LWHALVLLWSCNNPLKVFRYLALNQQEVISHCHQYRATGQFSLPCSPTRLFTVGNMIFVLWYWNPLNFEWTVPFSSKGKHINLGDERFLVLISEAAISIEPGQVFRLTWPYILIWLWQNLSFHKLKEKITDTRKAIINCLESLIAVCLKYSLFFVDNVK